MIISHEHPQYVNMKPNGALIYSINICKYISPRIKTDRNWVTINIHKAMDHSIIFIHSNVDIDERYSFLKDYKDLILVCSQKSTMMKVRKYGHAIYLPLSIDVPYTKSFARSKDRGTCYAGRRDKIYSDRLKGIKGIDYICDYSHTSMLETIARYKNVYAVGLTALEAKALGCKILPYDDRFPDVNVWKVRDCRDVIDDFQKKLDLMERKIRNESRNQG